MSMHGESAYATAKAAVVGLTRSLAVDYAKDGITANAVAPGWVHTGSQTEHEARESERVPLGRSASPAEVASVAAFSCKSGCKLRHRTMHRCRWWEHRGRGTNKLEAGEICTGL